MPAAPIRPGRWVFLAIAAVASSLDRLTVDIALTALVAGVVCHPDRNQWRAVWILAALGGLARETGIGVCCAIALWLVLEKDIRRAVVMSLSVLPACSWFLYLRIRMPRGVTPALFSPVPFQGFITRLLSPVAYPFGFGANALATALDYAALAGIAAALIYCALHLRHLIQHPDGWIALAFAGLAALISTQAVWGDIYAFGRVFSPLTLIVWLDGFRTSSRLGSASLALVAPRAGLQIGSQFVNVGRGLLGI